MNEINIPNLTEMKHSYIKDDLEMFQTCDVLDFYIKDNSLIYPVNNIGGTEKIKCIKNFNNKYKIFAYKTIGVLSHSIYFLLDVEKQVLYRYNGGQYASSDIIKEWVDYLLSGGSYEKAIEYNKSLDNGFDPFQGI